MNRPCRHCGATFRAAIARLGNPWKSLQVHERRCVRATPDERAHFARRGRWPVKRPTAAQRRRWKQTMRERRRELRANVVKLPISTGG